MGEEVRHMSEQISPAVWNRFVPRRSTGDVANGLVVKVLPFGAFVEIDGVTGLLRSDSAQPASRVAGRDDHRRGPAAIRRRNSLMPTGVRG
jgi:hypothetical protein